MKISVFEVEEWEFEAYEGLKKEHQIDFIGHPLSAENAKNFKDTEILSTFIYSDLTEEVLQNFENLKLIASRSTGFDHIAGDYCQKRGIIVSNVPTYGKNTVAEHVFGLLLTISHKLIEAIDRTRRGDFSQEGLQGFDLRGKTIGVMEPEILESASSKSPRGFG